MAELEDVESHFEKESHVLGGEEGGYGEVQSPGEAENRDVTSSDGLPLPKAEAGRMKMGVGMGKNQMIQRRHEKEE